MIKINKYVCLFLSFVVLNVNLISNTFAQVSRGDSVMTSPTLGSTPTMKYQGTSASSGNIYNYTASIEYQNAVCPTGLTVSSTGSSIYHSAQRVTTYTYLGAQLVGTNVGSWTDIDTDCTGTQTQTIPCPAGYNGSITQQQKVGTGVGGYVYGGWVTTANNCVPVPVLTCDAFDNTNNDGAISGSSIAWSFIYPDNSGNLVYRLFYIIYKGQVKLTGGSYVDFYSGSQVQSYVQNTYGYQTNPIGSFYEGPSGPYFGTYVFGLCGS